MDKLVAMKMNIDDEMQASLLLNSLPDSWDTLVVTISNSTPNEILTMESVKDSLLNEEAIRKEKKKGKKNQKRCGRSQSRNPHGFRGRSKSKIYIKCYHYNKFGHVKKECRIWKKE